MADSPPTDDAGHAAARQALVEHVNREREALGLAPVVLSPVVTAAAQAQVDDLTARDYYDLKAPDGREIEDWLRDAGYDAQLVTEKLAHTDQSPAALAATWRRFPESQRASLFHPEVQEIGVGIGERQGLALFALVLTRSRESYLADYVRHLFAEQEARFTNLDALREEMLRLVNEARAARGRDPLRLDARLNEAAQEHARTVFAALEEGRQLPDNRELGRRVRATGFEMRRGFGESVVHGALSPQETMDALLGGEESPKALAPWVTDLGLGLAFKRTAAGFSVVWVQCFARSNRTDSPATPP